MLVLTRDLGQVVRIGEDISIVIQFVKGSNVSLGIIAPKSVKVVRGELLTSQAASESGNSPATEDDH